MKFLADQDVYAATVQFLRQSGHEVETASERGMSQADDADLLRAAGAMTNGNPVRRMPTLIWLGALVGAILAWSLAATEVTAVVFRQNDRESGWHYRVQVLGIEIDRGDAFGSGPVPKLEAWRTGLALGSAYIGAIAGGSAAFFYSRRTKQST